MQHHPAEVLPEPDPGDDYLIALAQSQRAALVSGDKHLLQLAGRLPIFSARQFIEPLVRC